jgi:hypothetical protein
MEKFFHIHLNNGSKTLNVVIQEKDTYPEALHYSIAIYISVLAVFSIIGNVLTIFVLNRYKFTKFGDIVVSCAHTCNAGPKSATCWRGGVGWASPRYAYL